MNHRNKGVRTSTEKLEDQNQESIQNFSCRNNFEKISLECYDKYDLGKIHKRLNKQNRKVQNNN